jgi:uncharacterized protein (DUF2461 family)
MNNTMKQRMHRIKQQYPHVEVAYHWLRENRDKFRGRVYGPLALDINVKDTRYASMIESVFGGMKGSIFRVRIFLSVF